MKREIKFRAWYGGKMRENKEALRLLYNNSSDCEIFHTESIFMQFTGLTDKNGKEIYEMCEINNEYRIIYKFNKYILQSISNNDIFVEIKENDKLEITREYSPLS